MLTTNAYTNGVLALSDNLSLVCVQEAAALLSQLTDASFPRKMDLDAGDLPWRDFKRGCAAADYGGPASQN